MKKLLMTGVRHPWLSFAVSLAITVIMSMATVNGARIETDLDEYMPSDHPAFVYSDAAEELFGIDDGILIAITHPDTIFNTETLQLIREITERLSEDFDEIEAGDITSLYTAENIIGTEWGMEVEPFYTRIPTDPDSIRDIRRAVESNEMISGRVVSTDGTATLIIAEIDDQYLSNDLYVQLTDWITQFEGVETVAIAGRPIVEGELAKLGPADMARMAPLVILITAIMLLVLLRSVIHTIINLFIVGAATIWAFGAMTLLGVPVYSVSTMIPVMLIAIGTAFGIHLHNAAHLYRIDHPDADRIVGAEYALGSMLRPVSMAAITTAIGFLSLLTSQVLPVRYFGAFTALGVMIEMLLALILIPGVVFAFEMRIPPSAHHDASIKTKNLRWTARFARTLEKRAGFTVLVAVAVVVLAGWGVSRVWIDTSFLANFEDDSSIVLTDTLVNDNFPGTSSLNIVLSSADADRFKDPEVLSLIDSMQAELETHPEVGASFALTDYLKRMHRVMHEDDPNFYAIPENQDLVAQYLLLYEMSGDPDNLTRVVDYNYQEANVTVQLKSDSSAVMDEVLEQAVRYEEEFTSLGVTMNFAGSGYKTLVFAQLLLSGQMWSLLIAFGIVAVLLSLVFHDLWIGLIGTIPIAITAVVNFGAMGLLGIPLSSSTAIISSIAIGIGVDYAIHLIERFREYQKEDLPLVVVAERTLAHSGRAILFNALAVMGGFAVLLWSLFPPNRQVGGLVALNMASSAIGTLTVLLAILIWYSRRVATNNDTHKTVGGNQ